MYNQAIGKLLSKKICLKANAGTQKYLSDESRNKFHKDYDKVIFSNSFRRLSRKTQVHPLAKNDHVHNRLTHSLEVASVGRSLGLRAGEFLQEKYKDNFTKDNFNPYDVAYIVQTACLAHDIGNPPFGHTGEDVIKKWFSDAKNKNFICELTEDEISDFKNFDGNAQSFRIVTQLENNPFNCGMRLTFATLATLIKYPYPSSECISTGKEKFSFFQSESEFFDDLFSHMGLKKKDGKFIRHPLSYLMEAGDDICYGLLDLQDAIELDLIKIEDVRGIFDLICGKDFVDNIFVDKSTDIQKVSRLIANAINNLTNHTAETFRNNFNDLLNGSNKCLISLFSKEDLKEGMDNAKNFAKEKIFSSKIDKEKLLGETIKIMLDYLIKATYNLHRNANKSSKSALDIMSYHDRPKVENSLYENYQRVLDYIVGMTDNYAVTIADRLNKGEF